MVERKEDMLRFVAEQYASMAFGPMIGQGFGLVVGVVFALLLLSAVNTAVAAQLGLGRLWLHAAALGLIHPVSARQLDVRAPLPPEWSLWTGAEQRLAPVS